MDIWKSFCGWFGFEDEETIPAIPVNIGQDPAKKNNRLDINSNKSMKIILCEPEMFEEVQAMAGHLKNGNQVVIRFDSVSSEVAQRMVDFLAGVVCSLNGQSQQVGHNIFLFVPSNVEISKDLRIAKPRLNIAY